MVFFMLTRGEAFVDLGQQRYEKQQRERPAAALGFQITQTPGSRMNAGAFSFVS